MKTITFLILLIIFSILVVADEPVKGILEFNSYAKELSNGETYQANYRFNFKPESFEISLIKPDLTEYKPGVIFLKLRTVDYLYFYIPEDFNKGDYKLRIKSRYLVNNILRENIYEETFEVNDEFGIRIINPVVFLEGKEEFRVSLLNLGSKTRNIQLKEDNHTMPFRSSVELNPNERKDLLFRVKDNNFDISYLNFFADSLNSSIKEYKMPLVGKEIIEDVERKDLEIPNIAEEKELIKFLTKKNIIDLTLKPKEYESGFVQFMALKDLSGVEALLSGDIKEIVDVNISQIGSLFKDQVYNLKIEINKKRSAIPGVYDGFLNLVYSGGSINMKINVIVLDDGSYEVINQTENVVEDIKPKTNLKKEKPIDARYLILAFFILLIIVYLFYKISRTTGKNVKDVYGKFRK